MSLTTRSSLLEQMKGDGPGRDAAWETFVKLYGPFLLGRARRRFSQLSAQDIEDLTQEVMTRVWRALPEFRHNYKGRFRSWLETIVKNAAIDFLRRKDARPCLNGLDLDLWPDDENSEADLQTWIVARAVDDTRPETDPQTWAAFESMTIHARPAREVATELNISVAAVYSASARVLRRVRERVNQLHELFS
jgi:RNA polymerase sigma factor (sigma-70 family)